MKKTIITLLSLLSPAFAEQVTVLGINDMHANIDSMPPAVGVMNRSDDIAVWFALSPPEINL